MSDVKEILGLMKLHDSLLKEYNKEFQKSAKGLYLDEKESGELFVNSLTDSFSLKLRKVVNTFYNNILQNDAELQKIYNEKGKDKFEKKVLKKYKKEFNEMIALVREEQWKSYEKKIEEIDQKLDEYPTKSLMSALSLYYAEKGATGAKKTGKFSMKIGKKTGKFFGNTIKDGTLYLWDNKEEIRDKMVNAAMKREEAIEKQQKRFESEYSSLKARYEKYSNQELLKILKDENEKGVNRRVAQRILKARR